jgi:hypothetical protein
MLRKHFSRENLKFRFVGIILGKCEFPLKNFFREKLKFRFVSIILGKSDSVGFVNAQKAFFQGNLTFRLVSIILGKWTILMIL